MSTENAYFTDVHVHLQDPMFQPDIENVLRRAYEHGVKRFVCNGTEPNDWARVRDLAARRSDVIPCFGVHPWFVERVAQEKNTDWTHTLREFLCDDSTCGPWRAGLGEIGLDHLRKDRNDALQEQTLRAQLNIAQELQLPISLHSVRAVDRLVEMLDEFEGIPLLLFHSFSGSAEQLAKLLGKATRKRKGFFRNVYFSFSATILKEKNYRAIGAARLVPNERILIESDAPALAPMGSSERNEPSVLPEIAVALASIRGISEQSMKTQLHENAERFLAAWPKKTVVPYNGFS